MRLYVSGPHLAARLRKGIAFFVTVVLGIGAGCAIALWELVEHVLLGILGR